MASALHFYFTHNLDSWLKSMRKITTLNITISSSAFFSWDYIPSMI